MKEKNSLYSLIEASIEPKYNRSFGYTSSRISVYLYEKNKPYPENYIGRTPRSLVKRFGISEKEAIQLFIKEISTLLKTVQSDHVRDVLKKKITNLNRKYHAK